MSAEKIQQLNQQRRQLTAENKKLHTMRKYHMQKFEEMLADAEQYLKKVKTIDATISTNHNTYYNLGTQLEELTGQKRISSLT